MGDPLLSLKVVLDNLHMSVCECGWMFVCVCVGGGGGGGVTDI